MKSVRTTIVAVTAGLVLLPFVLLAFAWLYERALAGEDLDLLERLGRKVAAAPKESWAGLARANGAWLRQLGPDGAVRFDSQSAAEAESFSLLGGVFEAVFTFFGAASPGEPLRELDARGAPFLEREELVHARASGPAGMTRTSESGQTLLVSWAHALPDGSVLLFEKANHRGVRQLLLARNQLVKLVLTQLLVALLVAFVAGRWLVRPLERLADGARAFPTRPIADAPLLTRDDELGQVARAFNALAQSLESRRQNTARLAADMAHEFKNPLATIEAASELAASTKAPTPEKLASLHATIHEAVARLMRTTEALVAEVKLETALADAKRDELDYRAWLDALLDTYRSDPQHAGWTFELEVAPNVGRVRVVAEAWARLVRNLVDNARVQPSEKKLVRLEVRRTSKGVFTDVVDFGPGVSEGNRDKIFRRFFTLRPEGAPPGMGLGLSIVESIAQAHGGMVRLEPAAEGRGATFRVVIPES